MRFPRLISPILTWEMTTLVRRQRYYWLRSLYALLLLFLLWSVYSETFASRYFRYQSNEPRDMLKLSAAFASAFFAAFSVAQITAILVLTPAYVATAITVERERRTIEYLFTTDLSNAEIVLGKWTARALNVLMVVLVGIPILGLTRFFGGISFDRMMLTSAVSLATLASTSAVAMFNSVHGRQTRRVVMDSYTFIFFLCLSPILPYAAAGAIEYVRISAGLNDAMLLDLSELLERCSRFLWLMNPYYFLKEVILSPSGLGSAINAVWILVASHLILAVLLLGISIVRLRSIHRKHVSQGVAAKRSWLRKTPKVRKTYAVRGEPVAWREWRFGSGVGRFNWFRKGVASLTVLCFLWPFASDFYQLAVEGRELSRLTMPPLGLNMYLRFAGTAAICIALAATASRGATAVSTERDKDTWVSLLSAPLSAGEIIAGKILGSLKPVVFIIGLLTPCWLFAVAIGAMSAAAVPLMLLWICLFGLFAASLGVYQSLVRASTGRAIGFTYATLALLCGGAQAFGLAVMIPLQLLFDVDEAWALYMMSMPWIPLGGSTFTSSELQWFLRAGKEAFWMLTGGIGSAVAYFIASAWLFTRSCTKFQDVTGRVEDSLVPVVDPRGRTRFSPTTG